MTDSLDTYRAALERAALRGLHGDALWTAAHGDISVLTSDIATGEEDVMACTASVTSSILPHLAPRRCTLPAQHRGPHQDANGVPFREEKRP